MKYYLGPWVWDERLMGGVWSPPAGVIHSIDLRPIPAQSIKNVQLGVGLFGMPDDLKLDSGYRLFGQGKGLADIVPIEADRKIFASMVGAAVDGVTFAEWMYTLLTLHSDVSGDTAVRPLMPSRGVLSACGIRKTFDLAMPEAAKVIANIQEDYRTQRVLSLENDDQAYLKVLDFLGKQYGIARPQDVFIPADLPKETPVKHDTTISDDFNRANAATLGTSAAGWSWTTVAGFMAITGNAATPDTGGFALCSARAEFSLSSADHETTIAVSSMAALSAIAAAVRYDPAAFTHYTALPYTGDSNLYLQKFVAGTATNLGNVAITQALPEPYKCQINGSTLKGFQNGVERISVTDTSITGYLRTGIYGNGNTGASAFADSFTASDLAAATAKLFLPGSMSGLGSGGPFFHDRLA